MVAVTGFDSLDALVDATVPKAIRRPDLMDLGAYTEGMRESEFLTKFKCVPAPHPRHLHESVVRRLRDVREVRRGCGMRAFLRCPALKWRRFCWCAHDRWAYVDPRFFYLCASAWQATARLAAILAV